MKLGVLIIIVMGLSLIVQAGSLVDYDETQFKQAQVDGKTIVLDFHAEWCGSCKTQKMILKDMASESDYDNLLVFAVNYDDSESLKTELKVDSQGTLIVYKGAKEVARGYGIIKKNEIADLVAQGL